MLHHDCRYGAIASGSARISLITFFHPVIGVVQISSQKPTFTLQISLENLIFYCTYTFFFIIRTRENIQETTCSNTKNPPKSSTERCS